MEIIMNIYGVRYRGLLCQELFTTREAALASIHISIHNITDMEKHEADLKRFEIVELHVYDGATHL
jgi:hypothetical protein